MMCVNSYAQQIDSVLNIKLDLLHKNISVTQLLDSIAVSHNIHFSYNPSSFRSDSIISVNYKNTDLHTILSEIIDNPNIQISAIQNQIIFTTFTQKLPQKNDTTFIVVSGEITSSKNGLTIPYVNISIQNQHLGTISNSEGRFSFKIPEKFISSFIQFSCIGYTTLELPVPAKDTIISIELKNTTIELAEIKVIQMKAADIVDRCYKSISANYAPYPMLLTSFFRERLKQNNQYIQVSEAVIEIYKGKYSIYSDSERVKFIIGRKKETEKEPELARLKIAGGPALFAELDIVKHLSFFNTLESPDEFSYKNIGQSIYKDRILYHIAFKPNIPKDEMNYEGILFIDSQSFALQSATFRLTKKSMKYSSKLFIKKSPKKIRAIPTYTNYNIEYTELNHTWYLHKVTGEIQIELQHKRNKKRNTYTAISELLITDGVKQNNRSFKTSDSFKTSYILADQINTDDKSFWKAFNIIKPEDDIEKVFKGSVDINIIPKKQKKPNYSLPGF